MNCTGCIWLCMHNISDSFMNFRIKYCGYKEMNLVSVNGQYGTRDLERRLNQFYLCNKIHDVYTFKELMCHDITSIAFYYKNKYVHIDIANKRINIGHGKIPIILNDISLNLCCD